MAATNKRREGFSDPKEIFKKGLTSVEYGVVCPMETIQNLGTISEDGYGSQSILLRIAVDEEKVGAINYAGFSGTDKIKNQRIEKWLKLRRIRLARKELENSGYIRPMRYSSYDCTGQIFTSGIEFIYAATGYALVRMDYCRDI